MPALGHAIAFVLGNIAASFANVCIHRLPQGLSVIRPASQCPSCQHRLRPWHLIPLVSFVALRGRCAFCCNRISWRYPGAEGLGGLLYLVVYHQFGFSVQGSAFALLVTALLIVSFIDARHMIIPDAITLPGVAVGLLISLHPSSIGFTDAVASACMGWGFFFILARLYPAGMGAGDAKLVALIGAFVGWQALLVTIILGAFCGAMFGLALVVMGFRSYRDPLPFGPFLAAGAVISMLCGDTLLAWYGGLTLTW